MSTAPVSDHRKPSKTRVLIVDDSREIVFLLGRLLNKRGLDVETATDVSGAIDCALRYKPEVIVSDFGLPSQAQGLALAQRLKSEPSIAGSRLIAVTGNSREEDHQNALAFGFERVLMKPINLDELAAVIECNEEAEALA